MDDTGIFSRGGGAFTVYRHDHVTAFDASFGSGSATHCFGDNDTVTTFGIFDNQTEQICATFLLIALFMLCLPVVGPKVWAWWKKRSGGPELREVESNE